MPAVADAAAAEALGDEVAGAVAAGATANPGEPKTTAVNKRP